MPTSTSTPPPVYLPATPSKTIRWLLALTLLLSWLAGAGVPAHAQATWQKDPMLSQLLIQQLVQDQAGFLWAATDDGLYRYDGYLLVSLNDQVRRGSRLPAGPCQVVRGRQGDLWVLCARRLYRYSTVAQTLTAVRVPDLPTDFSGLRLVADTLQDRLWVSSTAHCVMALTLSQGQLVPGSRRRLRQPILWVQAAPRGQAWVGLADHSLVRLGGNQPPRVFRAPAGRCVLPLPGTSPQQFASACAQYAARPDGRLYEVRRWLPTRGRRLSEQAFFIPHLQADRLRWGGADYLLELTRCPGATTVTAVSREAVRFDNTAGYEDPVFRQIVTDALGTEWCFSPHFRGCYRRYRAAFLQPLATARQQWYSTRALCQLPDQRLLVSSYAGLFVQAAGQPTAPLRPWTVYYRGQPQQPVFSSLLPVGAHHVLGAADQLCLLDVRSRQLRFPRLAAADSLVPPPTVLLPADSGRVWVGTRAGLFWWSPADERLHPSPELPARQWPLDVRALARDSLGALWVATASGLYYVAARRRGRPGIRRFATSLPAPGALPTNELLSLQVDGPRVWVGTRDAGVLLVDPRRGVLRHLSVADGLPSATVCSLLADDHCLWLGTYAGVARYRPATGKLNVFTTSIGLADNECNYQSALRAADHTLYFGGIKGVTRFLPRQIQADRTPPPRLLVSRYAVYLHASDTLYQYAYPRQHDLYPIRLLDNDQATVKVALTDFSSPETTRYEYRLAGLADSTWHQADPQQTVRLLDIPVGDYVIQIRAAAQADLLTSNLVRVPLQVRRTWWRYPGVAIAAVLLLLGSTYYYVRRSRWWLRQQQQQLRRRLAHDLHDELGALLVRASLQAEQLRTIYTLTGPAAGNLIANLQTASQAMRDIVWGIDPQHNTLGDLLDRMREHLDHSATQLTSRHVTFLADQLKTDTVLSPLLRQHLYAVFKEAVTNSLRHARSSSCLTVHLTQEGSHLHLTVHDDGPLPATTGRSGVGLRSMRQRAAAMRGELRVGPGPTSGFDVYLVVPLRS